MNESAGNIDALLRRRVFQELRRSPALWDEYLRQKKARRPSVWQVLAAALAVIWFVVPLLVVGPYFLFAAMIDAFGTDLLLGLAGMLAAGISFFAAASLLQLLESSKTVAVCSHLPVSDADLAEAVWLRVAGGLLFCFYLFGFAYGVVAYKSGFDVVGWLLAMGLAVVQVPLLIAVGTLLAVNRPRWPYAALGVVSLFSAVALGMAAALFGGRLFPPAPLAEALYRITPGGWVGGALGLAYARGVVAAWWGLGAAGLLIAVLVPAVRHLKSIYRVKQFAVRANERVTARLTGPISAGPRDDDADLPADVVALDALFASDSPKLSADELAARIREGTFLRHREPQELGLVERVAYRRITPRDRAVVEFLAAEQTRWTDYLFNGVMLVGTLGALGLVGLAQNVLMLAGLLAFATMGVVFGSPFAVLAGPWPGILKRNSGGVHLTHWVLLPIDYREVSRCMFRTNFLRSLFVVPAVLVTFVIVTGFIGRSPWLGLVLTAGWFALLQVLNAWVVAFNVSGQFQMPPFRWRKLPLFLPPVLAFSCIPCGLLFLVLLAGMPFRPTLLPAAIAAGLVLGGVLVARYYFQWLYRSGRVDPCANKLSLAEESRPGHLEKWAAIQDRRRIVRKRHGPWWWLRRDLRRWANRTE